MDYSYIFRSAVPVYKRFADFGFKKRGNSYVLKRELSESGFYVLLTVTGVSQTERSDVLQATGSFPSDVFIADTLTAEVFEREMEERYVLFDVKQSNGTFVAELREEVRTLVEEFRATCFESCNLREKYEAYVSESFECAVDYPWPDYEGDVSTAVWRCPNNRMFALVMDITYRKFGFESDDPVSVVNLKVDPDKKDLLIDGKSVFPGYHMNKKHWVSVLLTAVTSWERLSEMTRYSYDLVKSKKR